MEMIPCSYVNWCESCSGVEIKALANVSTVDWSNCTDTRQYNMTVKNSDNVVLYRNSKTCCSGNLTIHYSIGDSKLHRDDLMKEQQNVYMNVTDVSTTEQVPQASQQMVAGTTHLPDYLLFVLGGISGFLFFTTIVTIVVFLSVKRKKKQSRHSFCVSQEVGCDIVESVETKKEERYIVKLESPTQNLPPQIDSLFQQVDHVNKSSSNQSRASIETPYVNTCEGCVESSNDRRSVSSDEATYMNTCEGYLDVNDLRVTASAGASCVRTVLKQPTDSDETTYSDTCEEYQNVKDLRPAKCSGPALDACPVLLLPWLGTVHYPGQIGEDNENASTLVSYIELC